ncbi:glutamate--tRNA ligase [Arcobacter sp. CECT 8985]|uniref:glutamate--tRNA ligase n=1 Tax=Arcobacter sp. CECT 8985 TaxID=1935424 RepID=UPI00100BD408|nr:glutamate--tRNA ligase [Arcobacter sp. CECT 8985]RXJ87601.1 glutamate--tRNA ligase [Arcobacter sp. CECT 8985]
MLRVALSQSKKMQIEDLRVVLFNFIMAKKLNEKLLIRIEDADKNKNIEGLDKQNLEILNLFSIDYSNVLYQSDNLKYHQKLTMQLMAQKKAFACFCSDEKLEELEKKANQEGKPYKYDGFCEKLSNETILEVNAPFTVRIKKPESNIKFTDLLKGNFDYSALDLDSFIILNHDKTPLNDYACAIDDMIQDISLIVRNENDISNTARQIYIRQSLGYDKQIDYIHLPNILNTNLDNEENSVQCLIEQGFLPVAIANYLVLLGNKTPTEIFTLEEAIEWFEIKNISTNTIKFDIDKLKIINRKHLALIDELRLSKLLGFADTDIGKLGKLYLEESFTLKEIKEKIDLIFSKKLTCKGFENETKDIITCLQNAPFIDNFDDLKEYITKNTNLKDESLSSPLKYVLTGQNSGPDLKEIYPLIKNYIGEIVKC